jgi:tetratricopeptide (TPR) repeat protein
MLSGDQRFFMLETIREFAGEQLRAHGEEQLLRERHYLAYLHFFRTADSHFRGPEAATWFARSEPEEDNLRAALQWTLDQGRYTDSAWLAAAASWFWLLNGQIYESARWIQRLLSHRQSLEPDLRLAAILWFYAFAQGLDDFQPIDRYTAEILQLLEGCSHPILHAAAWHWIAETTPDSSQTSAASEQGIALAREAIHAPGPGSAFGLLADSKWLLTANLGNYAKRLIDRGEFAQAEALSYESLTLFQAQGNDDGIADCLSNLGRLALLRGDLVQARNLFQEAITTWDFGSQAMSSGWRVFLGIVTLYSGDPIEARRLLTESLRIGLELKNAVLVARTCTYLAETALWEGDLDQAGHWLAQSLAHHADPRWNTIDQVERLFLAARLVTAQSEYLRAATLFGLADQVSTRINYVPAEPVYSLIEVASANVRAALAADSFAEAFAAGQQISLDEAFATILNPTTLAAGR